MASTAANGPGTASLLPPHGASALAAASATSVVVLASYFGAGATVNPCWLPGIVPDVGWSYAFWMLLAVVDAYFAVAMALAIVLLGSLFATGKHGRKIGIVLSAAAAIPMYGAWMYVNMRRPTEGWYWPDIALAHGRFVVCVVLPAAALAVVVHLVERDIRRQRAR
jgi:hypothetical protein